MEGVGWGTDFMMDYDSCFTYRILIITHHKNLRPITLNSSAVSDNSRSMQQDRQPVRR